MCILFIAVQQHPEYPLIIAANRDEFFARETKASGFWSDFNQVLAGEDLEAGGTWMGVTRKGHLAALTNYRDPNQVNPEAPSRGRLVSDYLISEDDDYAQILADTAEDYNGFNLLFGHWQNLQVYNNTDQSLHHLTPGYYALSNAYLNTPWPKVAIGSEVFEDYCQSSNHLEIEKLFGLLRDEQKADKSELPDTGIGEDLEHMLSSIFINTPTYGTRSSTVFLIDQKHQCQWFERSFDEQGQIRDKREFSFELAAR